jgi:hypothetical protein
MKALTTEDRKFNAQTRYGLLVLLAVLALLALLCAPARAQVNVANGAPAPRRPVTVPVFCGTGLIAAGVTNNNTSGVFGGLGSAVNSTGVVLRAGAQGLGLLIKYNTHGSAGSNALFRFSVSPDGTNFGEGFFVYPNLGLMNLSESGTTNGYGIFTNIPGTILGNGYAFRFEGMTNALGISNLVITASQP